MVDYITSSNEEKYPIRMANRALEVVQKKYKIENILEIIDKYEVNREFFTECLKSGYRLEKKEFNLSTDDLIDLLDDVDEQWNELLERFVVKYLERRNNTIQKFNKLFNESESVDDEESKKK